LKESYKLGDTPPTPTKSNNKENITPLGEGKAQGNDEQDIFVRQFPRRGSLTKLKRTDRADDGVSTSVAQTETAVKTEEVIMSGYFLGVKVVHETKRKASSQSKSGANSQNRDHTGWNYGDEGQLFEIHQDDMDMPEVESTKTEECQKVLDDEDDKENADPALVSPHRRLVSNRLAQNRRKTSK
jgi:hypothetical protein